MAIWEDNWSGVDEVEGDRVLLSGRVGIVPQAVPGDTNAYLAHVLFLGLILALARDEIGPSKYSITLGSQP